MTSKIYWINVHQVGQQRLATMARPRGHEDLVREIKHLKKQGVNCLVSLLEQEEAADLGLQEAAKYCQESEIEFIHFPIKDITTPPNKKDFMQLAEILTQEIKAGQKVVIHCRMGIGRSSILAATILIKFGLDAKTVFEVIRKYRHLRVPDTEEQKDWVLKLAKEFGYIT